MDPVLGSRGFWRGAFRGLLVLGDVSGIYDVREIH
jgi:hypothetical protein